jgi:hypothetical protein
MFNWIVEKRQNMVLDTAVQSTVIISSLFPKQVRDRLLQTEEQENQLGTSRPLRKYGAGSVLSTAHPIADFFPHCSVFFADVVGFTAWSRLVMTCQLLKF